MKVLYIFEQKDFEQLVVALEKTIGTMQEIQKFLCDPSEYNRDLNDANMHRLLADAIDAGIIFHEDGMYFLSKYKSKN